MITTVLVLLAATAFSTALGKVNFVTAATFNSGNQPGLHPLQDALGHCLMTADQLKLLRIKYYKAVNLRMLSMKDEPIGYDGGLPALSGCTLTQSNP
jgi:hypothetical protein